MRFAFIMLRKHNVTRAYSRGYVEPNRSRLQAGALDAVAGKIEEDYPNHVGRIWEKLARDSVARIPIYGEDWLPPKRWWGRDTNGEQMELDIVTESADGERPLVGECKLTVSARDLPRLRRRLEQCANNLPFADRYRKVHTVIFAGDRGTQLDDPSFVAPCTVLNSLV